MKFLFHTLGGCWRGSSLFCLNSVTGLFAFGVLVHRINRAGVKSHPCFQVLVPFLEHRGFWMRHKNVTFQQMSLPKIFHVSAAFSSRDFTKFKIFLPYLSTLLLFWATLVLLKGSSLLDE